MSDTRRVHQSKKKSDADFDYGSKSGAVSKHKSINSIKQSLDSRVFVKKRQVVSSVARGRSNSPPRFRPKSHSRTRSPLSRSRSPRSRTKTRSRFRSTSSTFNKSTKSKQSKKPKHVDTKHSDDKYRDKDKNVKDLKSKDKDKKKSDKVNFIEQVHFKPSRKTLKNNDKLESGPRATIMCLNHRVKIQNCSFFDIHTMIMIWSKLSKRRTLY